MSQVMGDIWNLYPPRCFWLALHSVFTRDVDWLLLLTLALCPLRRNTKLSSCYISITIFEKAALLVFIETVQSVFLFRKILVEIAVQSYIQVNSVAGYLPFKS